MEALAYLYANAATDDARVRRGDAPIDRLIATFKAWTTRRRQRRELAKVDGALLRDMGISSGEAKFEANKPFWIA
ncbi:MAG: DUF1127 domain-containing protein [Pseudomonadota bacterium]